SFFLEAKDLTALCRDSNTDWKALGEVEYGRKSSEQGDAQFRRSLYFVTELKAGDVVDVAGMRSVRPGYGVAPKYMDEVIGKRLKVDVTCNSPVSFELLSDT